MFAILSFLTNVTVHGYHDALSLGGWKGPSSNPTGVFLRSGIWNFRTSYHQGMVSDIFQSFLCGPHIHGLESLS